MSTELTETTVDRALSIATRRLKEAVAALETTCGTPTPDRIADFLNIAAGAIGLPEYDEAAIERLPMLTRAKMALLCDKLARVLPSLAQLAWQDAAGGAQ